MNYLLHTSLLLTGCFAYYWLVLRAETHFQLNRWVLLSCLVGSLLLPLITVPAEISLRQAIAEEQTDVITSPVNSPAASITPAETSPGEVPELTLTDERGATTVTQPSVGVQTKTGGETSATPAAAAFRGEFSAPARPVAGPNATQPRPRPGAVSPGGDA